MIGRLLCLLGFHRWAYLHWSLWRWCVVERCTRRGCLAERDWP